MIRFVLDADIVLCLRSLQVLDAWVRAAAASETVVLTSYIARHEVHTIGQDVALLERSGLIEVQAVEVRSEAGRTWRRLVKNGVHKGEAEAVAWCLQMPEDQRPTFASIDAGARRVASNHRVAAVDLMGFVVELIERERLVREEVEQVLSVWEDPSQQRGRPSDYTSFADTYARRKALRER